MSIPAFVQSKWDGIVGLGYLPANYKDEQLKQ